MKRSGGAPARGRGAAFKVAVAVLTLVTGAVVAATVQFFASPAVRGQLASAAGLAPVAAMDAAVVYGQDQGYAFGPRSTAGAQAQARPASAASVVGTEGSEEVVGYGRANGHPTPARVEGTAQVDATVEPVTAFTVPSDTAPATPPSPTLLIIPSLGVSERVVEVPVRQGQWDVSELGTRVGRLETTGEEPGDDYAMSFVGHVTVPWPRVGPFADLILLERGEEVIYRHGDVDYVYRVERILRVHPDYVQALYETDGNKILLATCSGWDFLGSGGYRQRLVTQAVLVRTEAAVSRLLR